jgi:amidase
MTRDWRDIAKEKREAILAAIPPEWRIDTPTAQDVKDITGPYIEQYLSQKEIEITNTDAVGIVDKAKSGAWSSVEITKAFCHRAALAHQLTNCLHEIFFDAALKDAENLDALYAKGKTVGPLHGLPVSLKDQFHVKDVETSMGYVGWIGSRSC